jgi:uncharacterized protein (DUF362 family)
MNVSATSEKAVVMPIGSLQEKLRSALASIPKLQRLRPGDRVAIKPNLTSPKPVPGVTTSTETLEVLVAALADMGAKIAIVESDGGYHSFEAETAFASHGLVALAKRYGAELVNLVKEDKVELTLVARGREVLMPWPRRLVEGADYFCSVPVPKVHCLTGISLAIKNQWGCVPDTLRLRFHPFFDEVITQLNARLPNAFALLDGRYGLTRQGPIEGDAVELGCAVLASSLGACDVVGAKIMGIDPASIRHLAIARRAGLLPALAEVEIEGPLDQFVKPGQFFLNRSIWNYVALSAWLSPKWNEIVYLSSASDLLHKVMYTVRKRPASLNNEARAPRDPSI